MFVAAYRALRKFSRPAAATVRRASDRAARSMVESLEPRELLTGASSSSSPILRPDHIVIVIEQDRASNAIGNPVWSYLNQLASTGLVFSNSHGVTHPSEPNTLALFSGSTQGIADNGRHHSFSGPNLAKLLFDAGLTFSSYAENLPANGSQVAQAGNGQYPDLYTRNLNAAAQFTDYGIDPATGLARPNAAVNKTFGAFSSIPSGNYASLPTVSFIIPNNLHNSHGSNEAYPWAGSPDEENNDLLRANADSWLHNNLDGYLQWARQNNSLLIVTQDEERWTGGSADTVTTVVTGDPDLFVPGVNPNYINHYNLLRTITDMYGLAPLGAAGAATPFTTNAQGQLVAGVTQTPSTTVVAATAPTVFGQNVTFTATVSASSGTPGGSVLFKDGDTLLGSATLNSAGQATFTTGSLAAGSHSIIAVYQGNALFTGSTSAAATHQVNKAATTTSVAAPTPAVFGQAVNFTATVSAPAGAPAPTGYVQFKVDAVNFGSPVALVNGTATSAGVGGMSVGNHAVTAEFTGSANYAASSSTSVSQVVNRASTGTTVSSNANPATVGQPVNFIATIAPTPPGAGTPTGTVQFFVDGVALGQPVPLVNGSATSDPATGLAAGVRTVTAVYAGDANFLASTSAGFAQSVGMTNDAFAGRTPVSGTTASVTGNNAAATKEAGEPNHAGNKGGKSLWWTWTAPGSGVVTLDTYGSTFDTMLAVYTGGGVSTLTSIRSNDDDPVGGTTASKLTFNATAGITYQFAVDGYNPAITALSGNVKLNLSFAVPVAATPTAVAASDGTFSDKVRVTWATAANATAYEVWRNTTNNAATASKVSAVDVTATSFDDATAAPGIMYFYFVRAKNATSTSAFSSGNSGYRAAPPPANDNFAGRETITGNSATVNGSTAGATKDAGEPNHAGNVGGRSVWYTWTATASGTLTIDTIGSSFDTMLGVYTGSSVSALTLVRSNDDLGGTSNASRVSFAVTAGTVYQIAIDGYNPGNGAAAGNFVLNLNLV